MTPTEKRLRGALEPFAEIASNHAGEPDWANSFVKLEFLRRAREALAAIPSETGGEDGLIERLRLQNGAWWSNGDLALQAADRIQSLQAQLASLRERLERPHTIFIGAESLLMRTAADRLALLSRQYEDLRKRDKILSYIVNNHAGYAHLSNCHYAPLKDRHECKCGLLGKIAELHALSSTPSPSETEKSDDPHL